LINFIFFILFSTGVGFIVYSVIKFKPVEKTTPLDLVEESIERLKDTISDADNSITEFSKISQNIFEEINFKHKELLYLYSIIEKKQIQNSDKINLNSNSNKEMLVAKTMEIIAAKNIENIENTDFLNEIKGNVMNYTNSKYKEIVNLKNSGMNISEIAKSLNIGQGEVMLVLEMERGK